MSIYEIIWYFFIYAFLGWCVEVAFFAVKTGEFVNRGFLNGPVCPIYGFGVAAVVLALTPLKDNLLLLFFGSMILTSALEFLTGFALMKLFHTRWWDYSNEKFNLKGYICLEFSILWGLGATFIMKVIHPLIAAAVGKVPVFAGGIMLCAFGAVLIFDLAATLLALRKMLKNLRLLSALAREVRSVSDKIGESISGGTLVVKEGAETAFEPYSDLAELRRAHKAEEAALAERHRAEEQALLESVLATEKARRSESREAKAGEQRQRLDSMKAELAEKLAAARKSSKHFLKAFPGFKSAEYQDIVEKLRKK